MLDFSSFEEISNSFASFEEIFEMFKAKPHEKNMTKNIGRTIFESLERIELCTRYEPIFIPNFLSDQVLKNYYFFNA